MGLFDKLIKNKGVKDVLKNVDIKEIKEEIGYLELQEKKLETQRQELEKEAEKLFQDSIGKSEATKRLNATKIKNLKDRIADIDKDLREINLRLGVLYKVQRLKEKAQKTYNSKVWEELVNNVDSETLEKWLVDQKIGDDEIMNKLRQLYNAQGPEEEAEEISPDEREILEAMEAVEKGEKKPEEATKEVTKEKETQ
ncbi:hypothetical protein [Acidianus brierleyi]|uniref:Chromosome assembly protein n=1 Tax=Acidianus brierleyi TaxID=41673 RepID=A0A2U9ID97_9CREN|nr:hypothetical protein [Acidianus brierleyi]AWR93992.1 hypothetical protein DFR85_04515 [Acidianus brierleyi]